MTYPYVSFHWNFCLFRQFLRGFHTYFPFFNFWILSIQFLCIFYRRSNGYLQMMSRFFSPFSLVMWSRIFFGNSGCVLLILSDVDSGCTVLSLSTLISLFRMVFWPFFFHTLSITWNYFLTRNTTWTKDHYSLLFSVILLQRVLDSLLLKLEFYDFDLIGSYSYFFLVKVWVFYIKTYLMFSYTRSFFF